MIGQTVYFFDINRRVYPKDGGVSRGPIWREHWSPHTIVSEKSRSWVTDSGTKIAKGRPADGGFAWTLGHVAEAEFVHLHGYRIADRVSRVTDAPTLRKIAELVGYQYAKELADKREKETR